ncbi:MAG: hypothetical protein AABW81_03285 [Nanoarchaeota archaeon]
MIISKYAEDSLWITLDEIKRFGSRGVTCRAGEINDIALKLECMGCIKLSYAEPSVNLVIDTDEAIRDILFGNYLINLTYLKELPIINNFFQYKQLLLLFFHR